MKCFRKAVTLAFASSLSACVCGSVAELTGSRERIKNGKETTGTPYTETPSRSIISLSLHLRLSACVEDLLNFDQDPKTDEEEKGGQRNIIHRNTIHSKAIKEPHQSVFISWAERVCGRLTKL